MYAGVEQDRPEPKTKCTVLFVLKDAHLRREFTGHVYYDNGWYETQATTIALQWISRMEDVRFWSIVDDRHFVNQDEIVEIKIEVED